MNILGVIPARYQSSRFPGKPLADIHGKPMIWWVYQKANQVPEFSQVYVATDDDRISTVCQKFQIPVILTSSKHATGTDRMGEVAQKIKSDVYVNIQGDEPLVDPAAIQAVLKPFIDSVEGSIDVTCLRTEIKEMSDLMDMTVPKVVVNEKKEAVYFSRLPIPYPKRSNQIKYFKQISVYGFRERALHAFCQLTRGEIELIEDIELLRLIENNIKVQMVDVPHDTIAVDTPNDLERVRKRAMIDFRMFLK